MPVQVTIQGSQKKNTSSETGNENYMEFTFWYTCNSILRQFGAVRAFGNNTNISIENISAAALRNGASQ